VYSHHTTDGQIRPEPAVAPAADDPGDLIAQLTTIIFHVARTAPSQSETVRWTTSWLNYLSHVTDSAERWSIDTEELRP
jgi:hypothetical protein